MQQLGRRQGGPVIVRALQPFVEDGDEGVVVELNGWLILDCLLFATATVARSGWSKTSDWLAVVCAAAARTVRGTQTVTAGTVRRNSNVQCALSKTTMNCLIGQFI